MLTLPGSGGVVSVGDQMVCTGATGEPATCVFAAVQSNGAVVVSNTETFSAVRTPYFTITSGGARAAGAVALGVVTFAVGAVCML